jgi:ABC-type Fe3+ transport system permease subunit
MRRLIAAILAIPALINGLAMIVVFGPRWYETASRAAIGQLEPIRMDSSTSPPKGVDI